MNMAKYVFQNSFSVCGISNLNTIFQSSKTQNCVCLKKNKTKLNTFKYS